MIQADIQSLAPGALVSLYTLDTTAAGKGTDIYYFHDGNAPITWQGHVYSAWPIEAGGFDCTGKGTLPRPSLKLGNATGLLYGLAHQYDDLCGCAVTRHRTFSQYLDGQPGADPTMEFPLDVYFIERKVAENPVFIEFELVSAMDLSKRQLPNRIITQNFCMWKYRGAECGYTGTAYFDVGDNPVASLAQDVCGKRLLSCKNRFGVKAALPFGGFPGARLYKNQ